MKSIRIKLIWQIFIKNVFLPIQLNGRVECILFLLNAHDNTPLTYTTTVLLIKEKDSFLTIVKFTLIVSFDQSLIKETIDNLYLYEYKKGGPDDPDGENKIL